MTSKFRILITLQIYNVKQFFHCFLKYCIPEIKDFSIKSSWSWKQTVSQSPWTWSKIITISVTERSCTISNGQQRYVISAKSNSSSDHETTRFFLVDDPATWAITISAFNISPVESCVYALSTRILRKNIVNGVLRGKMTATTWASTAFSGCYTRVRRDYYSAAVSARWLMLMS